MPHFFVWLTNIFSNRHIRATLSPHESMLVTTMAKPLTSERNQLGSPTLASLQRVYLRFQLLTIISDNLNTTREELADDFGTDINFKVDTNRALAGLMLFCSFSRRANAAIRVARATGEAPWEVPDSKLLGKISRSQCEDYFVCATAVIQERHELVVKGLNVRAVGHMTGSLYQRFEKAIYACYCRRSKRRQARP